MNSKNFIFKHLRQIPFSLVIAFALLTFYPGQSLFAVTSVKNLRVEYMKNPIGIDTSQPRFSWEMESDEIGKKQSAYEIIVSNEADGSIIWNSGFVDSSESLGIKYNGAALDPTTRYTWKVNVRDNNNSTISSTENAFFETGLMTSGWSDAKWIKITNTFDDPNHPDHSSIVDYSISVDFEIKHLVAGVCFGASQDRNNYYMWQINIGRGPSLLRPHSWRNGNVLAHGDVDFTNKIKIESGKTYTLRIDIQGDRAITFINDIEIDNRINPRVGNYGFGDLGFRQYQNDIDPSYEQAYFDNIKVNSIINQVPTELFSETFSNNENFSFTNGTIDNGRLLVGGSQNTNSWQNPVVTQPVNFTLSCDMTIVDQNVGVIFGAKDVNNMFMWAINTHRTTNNTPVLRRHFFKNGNVNFVDISLEGKFTLEQIIGVERELKIDVVDNVINTYLDNTLIDKYYSPELRSGFIGFRVYTGDNDTHEHAYIDNVVYKHYVKDANGNPQEVIYTENFENGSNDFDGTNTIVVNGNTKMDLKASGNSDFRVLQGASAGIPMFRTEFSLDKEIKSARVYSSGLGIYDVFINGKRVGTPQADGTVVYDEFKPGWTDYRKTVFYSTYDVTALLKSGQNAVGAQVSSGWLNGTIAHNEYGNPDLGFLAKLIVTFSDGSQEIIVTDPSSWKSSTNSAIRMADIYNGETYDARKNSNWTVAGFDDSNWSNTTINNYFTGEILAFIGQPVQVRPELEQLPKTTTIYNGVTKTGSTYGEINTVNTIAGSGSYTLKKGETAIIDFGQNIVGWIKFKVQGASGTKLRGRFAEMLNDSGDESRGNDNAKGTLYLRNLRSAKATLNYILRGDEGGETFNPSMTFFGFRYCEISASEDIVIQTISGEVVGNSNEETSAFSTNNELVNKLYSNVIWGQRGNFLSVPTDCPQRDERLGWMGDTQIFSRAATYNADVASFFHKWVKDVQDSQQADGTYPSVVPDNWNVGYGRTAWAEAGIIVPWNMYIMYNDVDILKNHYESMERFMGWMATQQFDGYLYNGGNTQYGDWLAYENTNPRFISVTYYAYIARLMSKISKVLSKTSGDLFDQNSTKYNTLYNNIKAEFQKRYVSPRSGLLLESSQTAYLLALSNDLFPTPQATKSAINFLVEKIKSNGNKLSTGFVGTGILNQTLSQNGASDTAYELLLQRNDPSWLYSVDQGATTIWERWNSYTIANGFGDPGMNSFNHYSYGAVSEWMFRYMAGIEVDENNAGFKHFILQPTPDLRNILPKNQITNVDATYGSYYGPIKSKWEKKSNGTYRYSVTVPANTTATMYIIKTSETKQIGQNGIVADKVPGVKSYIDEGTRFVLELESGNYVFDSDLVNTSISDLNTINDLLNIYPNPVEKGKSIIVETNFDKNKLEKASLELYSLQGKKLANYKIHQEKTPILISQNSGAYILELKLGEKILEKRKVVVM